MTRKHTSVSEDITSAEQLEAHVSRMRDDMLNPDPWYQIKVPWPIWTLATIGATFSIGFVALLTIPVIVTGGADLIRYSLKWWMP